MSGPIDIWRQGPPDLPASANVERAIAARATMPAWLSRPVTAEPEPLPPIESRFLFVDVAALRAKQLRKGARPRLEDEVPQHHKAERVAMEEVRRGLVYYDVPPSRPAPEAAE